MLVLIKLILPPSFAAPTGLAYWLPVKQPDKTVVAPVPAATAVPQKLAERETTLTHEAQRILAQTLDHYAASVATRGGATVFTLK